MAMHHNLLNARRASEKSPFYTNTIAGNTSHREVGVITAMTLADDRTFEFLNSFVVTFFDP
jgi:hypothetical protein